MLIDFGQHLPACLVKILAMDTTEELCDLSLKELSVGVIGIASFDFLKSSGSAIVVTVQILGTPTCKEITDDLSLCHIFWTDFANIEPVRI